MAEEFVTVVTYDTTDAVEELEKLNNTLKRASDDAEKSFDAMGSSSRTFERHLDSLTGSLGGVFDDLKGFAAEFGTTGLVVGTVGAAFAALAANLIDIPELTRDAAAATAEQNAQLEEQLGLLDRIDDLGTARLLRGFEEQTRALNRRRVNLTEEAIQIDEQREVLQNRLHQFQEFYKNVNSTARSSVHERESLEKRLERLQTKREVNQVSGLPIGRQILELISRAQQAGGKQDFDRAEKLLEQARRIAEKSGDQSGFFNRQIQAGEDQLTRQIEQQVAARKKVEQQINAQKAAIDKLNASAKTELANLTARQRENRRQTKGLRAESRDIALTRNLALDEDRADDAARKRAAAHQAIVNILNSERSKLQEILDLSKLVTGSLRIGGTQVVEQARRLKEAQSLVVGAAGRLSNRSTADDEAAAQDIVKAREIIAELNTLRAGGGFSKALNFNLDNLNAAAAKFNEIVEAGRDLEAAGRSRFRKEDEQGLFKGTDQASTNLEKSRQEADALAEALTRAADASARISPQISGVAAGAPLPQSPGTTATTTASASNVNSTINVNATVKGGIIDAETTRAITDIIRRELRKGTGVLAK